jgi:large subunit ribosomal protein L31
MKSDIHPNYRDVIFYDTSSEFKFLTKSTIETNEVSSQSHPFYTGKKMLLDTAGRVEKFNKRYAKK